MTDHHTKVESLFEYPAFYKMCNVSVLSNKINEDAFYAYRNIAKATPDQSNKAVIPRILHYVWFTREYNPRQIPQTFLANLQLELNKLKLYNLHSAEQWQVKFWVSCEDCIASSLKHVTEMGYPIEIRKWQAEDFGDSRLLLKEKVTQLIELKSGMGAAYDLARFMIAEKYGGFPIDLDINTGNATEIIVQRGYHSLSSIDNNYIGFKPGHEFLVCANDYTLNFFLALEKLNINFVNLNADENAGLSSYMVFSTFAEFFLGKEDLYITPECNICDVKQIQCDNNFYYYNEDYNELEQCSVNPPAICVEANHQRIANSCLLVMNASGIDFGRSNADIGGTWREEW